MGFEEGRKMSAYQQLIEAEKTCHTIEIMEKETGKLGVANAAEDGRVQLFYGADDGSDDKTVTLDQFNDDYEITAMIKG